MAPEELTMGGIVVSVSFLRLKYGFVFNLEPSLEDRSTGCLVVTGDDAVELLMDGGGLFRLRIS